MRGRLYKVGCRYYASHAPSKTPLIFPTRPPSAPSTSDNLSSPSSSPPSSTSSSKSTSTSTSTSSSGSGSSGSGSGSTTLLPKPRLDYAHLLSNPSKTTLNYIERASPLSPHHIAHLSRLRETQLILLQKLSSIKNKQKEVGQLIQTDLGDREEYLRQAKKLKARVVEYEKTLGDVESELLELGLGLPNFSHPASPIGGEDQAVTLERFGPEPLGADPKRDHLDIANHYGLVDTEASAIASGNSWPYLKGALALLELALVNHAMSIAIQHGFQPVTTPDVVKVDLAQRCGFQPRDPTGATATQTYFLTSENEASTSTTNKDTPAPPTHCLAGTAEIPLSALFANKIIPQNTLPRKVVGLGKAFRAEAGARGTDTRGLYRVHQFTKVELFSVTDAEGSEGMMEEMRSVQKEIAESLGLSVRVLDMPTEELGASAARKYDMEAWMPGRGKWGEITSTSNCTDYQSRRLHIRYRPTHPQTDESLPFAHTLNGTAAAIPRLLVALIENGVRFAGETDGGGRSGVEGLDLPLALKRYWIGGDEIGEGKLKGTIRWV